MPAERRTAMKNRAVAIFVAACGVALAAGAAGTLRLVGRGQTLAWFAAGLGAVTDYLAAAMFAFRGQVVDGAFETDEVVRDSINDDFDGFVVFISAGFTSVHIFLSKR